MSLYTRPTFIKNEDDSLVELKNWDPPETSHMEFELCAFKKASAKRTELEPHVNEGIEYYFKNYHKKQVLNFDCYSFVNRISGIEDHPVRYLYAHWETSILSRPKRSEIIFLLNQKQKMFRHAAVYLGQGLYLSIYGGGGVS